jgi:tetratricopeptide (TPR) repeat protein
MREAALEELERRIEQEPEVLGLHAERADLLAELGRESEARDQYLAVLMREPTHCLALNQLGTLLYGTGYRKAANTVFAQAVTKHSSDAASRVNLANVLLENNDVLAAREHYAAALRLEPGRVGAHQGMARVLAELGDQEGAAAHRDIGYADHPIAALPYRGERPPVSVLLLVSAEGGNLPIRHLLDDRVFQTFVVTADYHDENAPLPAHHVVLNAIGDADLAGKALAGAQSILAHTTAPIINAPESVLLTGRVNNARRLRGLAGVVTPLTATLPRDLLDCADGTLALARHGFEFPVLVRTPGFHTGRHFVKVEQATDLADALAQVPGRDLTVMQYLDARGHDGKSRKYRVMMIDGQLYPLHAAISGHWKIHYFSAEMAESPEHRAEDAAFLENMQGVLGSKAITALTQIQSALRLDYAGIDFGLNEAGEVLLFEANATMVVLPPEAKPQWAYRAPAVERIHAAVRKMLLQRANAMQFASHV